jgi:hypothetical protein
LLDNYCTLNNSSKADNGKSLKLSCDDTLLSINNIVTSESLSFAINNQIRAVLEHKKKAGIKLPLELFFHLYLSDDELIKCLLANDEGGLTCLAKIYEKAVKNNKVEILLNKDCQKVTILLSNVYKYNYLIKTI